uniref:RING-type domain-containing protein n=1 Tax=Lotus japonicus TaxID=34305 RepID=I3T760_LOTJA|nr:unknown [Lotus japonicus]
MKSIHPRYQGMENLSCGACKAKDVSMLLIPCRHLSLRKDCDGFINVCPVCQMIKTASVEVYLS